jgi:hypothetical protein
MVRVKRGKLFPFALANVSLIPYSRERRKDRDRGRKRSVKSSARNFKSLLSHTTILRTLTLGTWDWEIPKNWNACDRGRR